MALFQLLTTISVLSAALPTTSATDNYFAKAQCPLSVGDRPTDGHERWRDCGDCHSYKYANSASGLLTATCPSGLIWNWKLDTPNCDVIDECDNCIESCEGKPVDTGRRWRSCTNCTQYVECKSEADDVLVLGTCPSGLYFNYKLAVPECDEDSSVCDTLTHVCADDCSFNVNGGIRRVADCRYCDRYATCLGGMALKHLCNDGLGYSLADESCQNITMADCRDRTISGG